MTNMNVDSRYSEPNELERVVDAGLASYPVVPLPEEFMKSVMTVIQNETNSSAVSPLSIMSRQHLVGFGNFLYHEILSVYAQIRRRDVFAAASFALLWCLIAGISVWTMRRVTHKIDIFNNPEQLSWWMPLYVVVGFALVIEMLLIYFYLEQRDS